MCKFIKTNVVIAELMDKGYVYVGENVADLESMNGRSTVHPSVLPAVSGDE